MWALSRNSFSVNKTADCRKPLTQLHRRATWATRFCHQHGVHGDAREPTLPAPILNEFSRLVGGNHVLQTNVAGTRVRLQIPEVDAQHGGRSTKPSRAEDGNAVRALSQWDRSSALRCQLVTVAPLAPLIFSISTWSPRLGPRDGSL